MTANLLRLSCKGIPARLKGILSFFISLLLISTVQSQAPVNAHRWTQGDGWRFNTSTNTWEAVFHPSNLPKGIIACASSAETESGIDAFKGAYNAAAFPINSSLTNCFNQDAPVNTPPRPTNVSGPTNGEDIIWVNFDIRPYAGTYQFQIVSNENLGWVLYYVDPAYAGPPSTNTATGTYPQTTTGLSGDINHLLYADCGLSGNGWSTITVPSFAKASNYYLAMWSVSGSVLANSVNLNFKARYGCGGSSCAIEMDGTPIVSCNNNSTYNVCTNFLGSAGEWTLVDDATTKAVSYEVKTYKLDNTLVNTYTSTDLSTTPIKFVLGTVDVNEAIKVSVCATYADGNNYNLKLLASAKPPGAPNDYVTCTSSPVIIGNAPLRPTNFTLSGGSYCAGGSGVNVILSSSQTGVSYQLQKNNVNEGSPVIGDGNYIDFGLKTFGVYKVIATNTAIAGGCSSTTSPITVTENPSFTINATPTPVDCFGGSDGSFTIAVTGGTAPFEYSNDGGTSFQPSATFNNLAANTYSIVVRDANLCQASGTVTITEPAAALNATYTQGNVDCFGGTDGSIDVSVTGGTAPYSYAWDNAAITEDLSGLAAGTYNLVVTDANGCTFPLQVIITEPPVLSLNFEAFNVLCNGGSDGSINLTVNGGTGPFGFLWTNGSTGEDLNNIPAGNYNVIVTDANGCIASLDFPVEISEPPVLEVSASITDVSCYGGSNGIITVLVQGGSEPYSYSLDGQNPVSNNVFEGLTAGTHTITVVDANGCSMTIYPKVIQPPVLNLSRTYVNPTCNGFTNGSITATFSGGKSPYTLYINGVSKGVQTSPYTFTNLGAGAYTIKVVDKNNCEKSLAVTLTQPQLLTCNIIPASPMPVCAGNTATLSATVAGGTSPYKYLWTVTGGNATIQSGGTTNKVVVNVGTISGTIEVTLKITDNKNCETTCKKSIIVINCLVNCTYTQGFYGSTTGKACNPTGVALIAKALIAQSIRNMPSQVLYLGLPGRSFTARVVDSARLNAIMPGGGTARILAGNYDLNSATSYPYPPLSSGKINNVLLSQTIALKLNVYMTPSQIQSLGNMPLQGGYLVTMKKDPASSCLNPKPLNCVVNGTTNTNSIQSFYVPANVVNALSTKTVMGLLDFASRKLGGEALPAGVSLSNINTAVDALNRAFDGCRFIIGWSACSQTCSNFGVTCPVTYNNFNPSFVSTITPSDWVKTSHLKDEVINGSLVEAFPNPFKDHVKISIKAQESSSVSVLIFNFLGQKIGQPFSGRMAKGETRIIEYRPGQQLSGGIIYQVRIGDKIHSGKLIFDKQGSR